MNETMRLIIIKISEIFKKKYVKPLVLFCLVIAVLFKINPLWFFMVVTAIIEALSCYALRQIFIKGWFEILSFATIVISLKFGFETAFYYYLGAYALSMVSRLTIYAVEPPFALSNALILSYVPTVLPSQSLFVITLISMILKRIALFPILAFIGGLPLFRNFSDSVLNILFSTLMVTYFEEIILKIM